MNSHAPKVHIETEILNRAGTKKIIDSGVQMDAKINVEVKDKNGVIKEVREVPVRSFVSNFARVMHHILGQVDNTSGGSELSQVNDTDNALLAANMWSMSVSEAEVATAGAVLASSGMVVGDFTDNNTDWRMDENHLMSDALAFDDFHLRNSFLPITATQYMTHSAVTINMSNSNTLTVRRTFTNESATYYATISEVGLIGKDMINSKYALVARDAIDDGGDVPVSSAPSDTITITYTISVSDSSGFTQNFLRLISSHFHDGNSGGDNFINLVNAPADVWGIASAASAASENFTVMESTPQTASIGSSYGIQVGGRTSTIGMAPSALSTSTYRLDSQILSSASGLSQGAMNALALSQEAGVGTKIGFYRDFTNNTTSTNYYIFETGLIGKGKIASNPASRKQVLLSRVLTPGSGASYTTILPGEILRIRYYLTFPLGELYT